MKNVLLAHKDQSLIAHLSNVSQRTADLATFFDGSEHGRLAGFLHDLGKAELEFQKRINSDDKEGDKQPHAHHGAAYALRICDPPQWPVGLAINGHHAGLHNRGDVDLAADKNFEKANQCLKRIRNEQADFTIPQLKTMLPEWLEQLEFLPGHKGNGWLATDLFTRFLFSALIDADRLDAEENSEDGGLKKQARQWLPFDPQALVDRLETELKERTNQAKSERKASEQVMTVRCEVGTCCRETASEERGLFSLTVPTGGGKTLASMLFALHHAIHHNGAAPENKRFRRIIVVIPYLNIIQQTAKEYRELFERSDIDKGRVVLEHHSQVEDDPELKGKKQRQENDVPYDNISERRRLAAENWDAPIVVTTSVQFFESLFSRRPTKARKLHNIAQSIIILDEIQTLPPLMLQPILSTLSELAHPSRSYGCSMVFCTATQPALGKSEDLPVGLENIRPIIPQDKAREHFELLKRVEYQWPDVNETLSWEELAEKVLSQETQKSLIVVNTRRAARELHAVFQQKLGGDADGLFHLSTWMIPAHRIEVLEEVKCRLDHANKNKGEIERCILVSTQCIESGVDVDFPSVWRAFGPYDSIVQAAGRCNRNGLMTRGESMVRIFNPSDSKPPQGLYSTAISQTELLRKMGLAVPDNPGSFNDYFRLLYQLSVPDECGIQRARSRLHFKEVDALFEFIEDSTFPVLVLYELIEKEECPTAAKQLYDKACSRASARKEEGYFTRDEWREIQPYILNLSKHTNSTQKEAIQWKIRPAFDREYGLFVWDGVYQGGLFGVGIDFGGAIPPERTIL